MARRGDTGGVDLRLDAVCTAALTLADRFGLARLTIRRVAEEVGVAPMTIYGAISSKDELVGLIAERALDELDFPPPDVDRGWQENIVVIMTATRSLLLRHPSLPQIFAAQRVSIGALGLAKLIDAVMRELDRGGLRGPRAVASFFNLLTFTLGYVLFELPRRDETAGEVSPESGLPDLAAVRQMAREYSLTFLEANAREIHRLTRGDYYEEGVRAMLAGLTVSWSGDRP